MAHIKPLRAKAYLYIALFFVIIIAASFFIGCGDNSVNNNTTNPPVTIDSSIVSLDSITSRISASPIYVTDSTINITNNDIDSLKISFTTETNATNSEQPVASILISDSNTVILDISFNNLSDFNRDYTYYCVTHNYKYSAIFHTKISTFASIGKYVKLKNIRITKL